MAKEKNPTFRIYKDRDSFRVKWWYNQKPYGIVFASKFDATLAAARMKLAITNAEPWPPELLKRSAIQRFLNDYNPISKISGEDLISEYIDVISGEVTKGWVRFTETCLEELEKNYSLKELSIADAQKVISRIGRNQSVSTRNKKLLVIKKFYNWAMQTHFWPQNPFAEIKKLRVIKINADIDYLTREEREIVLEKALEKKHGLAVWIALYTGMRRGEVFGLKWEDINFSTETVITQSKGGACRTIPLAMPLLERLEGLKRKSGALFGDGSNKVSSRWLIDSMRIELAGEVDKDSIGWNAFRHTFCTLLVQNGVSLDKVAMWAGHSAKICRQHYARFIPKDKKDTDIDRL